MKLNSSFSYGFKSKEIATTTNVLIYILQFIQTRDWQTVDRNRLVDLSRNIGRPLKKFILPLSVNWGINSGIMWIVILYSRNLPLLVNRDSRNCLLLAVITVN